MLQKYDLLHDASASCTCSRMRQCELIRMTASSESLQFMSERVNLKACMKDGERTIRWCLISRQDNMSCMLQAHWTKPCGSLSNRKFESFCREGRLILVVQCCMQKYGNGCTCLLVYPCLLAGLDGCLLEVPRVVKDYN